MPSGVESEIRLPSTTPNTGPRRHTRTSKNANGNDLHEEVIQIDDVPPLLEKLTSIETLLARQVWLLERWIGEDSSEITTDNI